MVHDVEELRKFYYRKFFEEDFNQMLKYADCLIVHNDSMKIFLRIVVLTQRNWLR
ncbi:hypothetical protein G134_597 [Lactobacillus delbrueckii subsp. lactis CRL581]|nr:hypothetical protein G134_597 [Lactobacillus delbrueckii subsp. lactis CRL581]